MKAWMEKIGLEMKISNFGVTKDMIEKIADSTLIMEGGYKVLTKSEIEEILKACL